MERTGVARLLRRVLSLAAAVEPRRAPQLARLHAGRAPGAVAASLGTRLVATATSAIAPRTMRCATALRPSARASAWTARSWSRVVARHASVLTDPVMQALLDDEKRLLLKLHEALARLQGSGDDVALVAQSIRHLEELFMVCVVGEFNSGKSSVINALVGERLLAEGVTPTTADVSVLRHGSGDAAVPSAVSFLQPHQQQSQVAHPAEWLRGLYIVDTPGTNAVVDGHQEITENIVPRADLIMFVTSADRPFSDSERQFLKRIWQWRKKVVVVVNKFDIVRTKGEADTILGFVRDNAAKLLGTEPQVFPVSAYAAMQAKLSAASGDAGGSGDPPRGGVAEYSAPAAFASLEEYVKTTLSDVEKTRLKLESPLSVASKLCNDYLTSVEAARATLHNDELTLHIASEAMAIFREDMLRQFKLQEAKLDNVLADMVARADAFIDERVRFGEVFNLLRGTKFQDDFVKEVVRGHAADIDEQVNDMASWLVERLETQSRDIVESLVVRASKHQDAMIGSVGYSSLPAARRGLLNGMRGAVTDALATHNHDEEVRRLVSSIRSSIHLTSAIEAGTLGLSTALFMASLLDWTGVAVGGVVAVSGLYLLPHRRSQLKADFREKIDKLRTKLRSGTEKQLVRELNAGMDRMEASVAPYSRFVRTEMKQLDAAATSLGQLQEDIRVLNARLAASVGAGTGTGNFPGGERR